MSKKPKSSFSIQNSYFRFKFFFDQNLDFALGNVNGAAAQAAALVAARAAEQDRVVRAEHEAAIRARQDEDLRRAYYARIEQERRHDAEKINAFEQHRRLEAARLAGADVHAREKALLRDAHARNAAGAQWGAHPPAQMKPGNYDYLKQYNEDIAKQQQHQPPSSAYHPDGMSAQQWGMAGRAPPGMERAPGMDRAALERNAIERMQRAHDQVRARQAQPGVPQRVAAAPRRGGYPPAF